MDRTYLFWARQDSVLLRPKALGEKAQETGTPMVLRGEGRKALCQCDGCPFHQLKGQSATREQPLASREQWPGLQLRAGWWALEEGLA